MFSNSFIDIIITIINDVWRGILCATRIHSDYHINSLNGYVLHLCLTLFNTLQLAATSISSLSFSASSDISSSFLFLCVWLHISALLIPLLNEIFNHCSLYFRCLPSSFPSMYFDQQSISRSSNFVTSTLMMPFNRKAYDYRCLTCCAQSFNR